VNNMEVDGLAANQSATGNSATATKQNHRVVIASPHVGRHLQDHPAVLASWRWTGDEKDKAMQTHSDDLLGSGGGSRIRLRPLLKWALTGRGPLASPACDSGAFLVTDSARKRWLGVGDNKGDVNSGVNGDAVADNSDGTSARLLPDLQLRFVSGAGSGPDGVKAYMELGSKGTQPRGITVQVVAVRARSQGDVRVGNERSGQAEKSETDERNKEKAVSVSTGYLTDAANADLASLREGLRAAIAMVERKGGRDIGEGRTEDMHAEDGGQTETDVWGSALGEQMWPAAFYTDKTSSEAYSDAMLDEYIRATVHSANGLCGTCRMVAGEGDSADGDSAEGDSAEGDSSQGVVDSRLRLLGGKGLRVVDASVIPRIPGGQLSATVYAIAEKGADLIKEDW